MKYVYANLKRFDVRREEGGLNSMAAPAEWGKYIISHIQEGLAPFAGKLETTVFLPESHIISAIETKKADGFPLHIGCQGVFAATWRRARISALLPPGALPNR